MKVLVTYGSKRGGTAGLAQMIAAELRRHGLAVDVQPAGRGLRPDEFDAVVVGGALYAFHWHKAARRFVRTHADVLRQRPTWLFSSGPLDDSAIRTQLPPVPGVARLMTDIGARGHVTFGGTLSEHARGFPASAMAKTKAGDWRDPGQVRTWADSVADELTSAPVSP